MRRAAEAVPGLQLAHRGAVLGRDRAERVARLDAVADVAPSVRARRGLVGARCATRAFAGIGMMSSVPGRSRRSRRGRPFASAISRARDAVRARDRRRASGRGAPRACGSATRFSGGRLATHSATASPAARRARAGRRCGRPASRAAAAPGSASRIVSTGSPAHSAMTRRSKAPSIGDRSRSPGRASGVTVKP